MSASVAIRFNAITGEAEKAFDRFTRTVAGFEKQFSGIASSVQGHQQRINQAFEQFSGDKAIREANELAVAIQKVGGAAKLTAAEQQNVNRVVTEAIAKYAALGQQAPKSLIDLANATKQLEQPTTLATKAMGVLGSAFGQFTLANLASNAIQNVIGKLSEFVAQGAKLPGLETSFNRLTTGIGQDSQKMLSTLQEATRGLVSNFDLMQSSNKAILLGLPVTAESMGELAKSATALGKAMGLDATQSLNDLITALGRSSPLILDNLGLTVKVGEANEAYAAKLGKTVEQLSDAERKMAFYEAAMEAARRKTAELGTQSLTLSERIDKAWVSIGNSVSGASSVINVALGQATSSMKAFATFVGDVAKLGFLGAVGAATGDSLPDGGAQGGKRKRTPGGSDAFQFEELQREAKAATEALAPLTAVQRELVLQFDKGGLSAQAIAEKLNSVKATAGVTERQIESFTEQVKKSTSETLKYRNELKALSDKLSGAGLTTEVKKLQEAFRGLTAEQRQNPAVMNRVADAAQALQKEGAVLSPELFQLTLTTGKFTEELFKVTPGLDAVKGGFIQTSGGIKETVARLTEFIELMNDPRLKASPLTSVEGIGWKIPKPEIPEPPVDKWREWADVADEVAQTIAEIFRGSDSGFARMVGEIANIVNAYGRASQAARDFRDATNVGDQILALAQGVQAVEQATRSQSRWAATAGGAATGAQVGGMIVPGWGHLIGGGIGALVGYIRSGGQGREMIEAFAEEFGGFRELQDRLVELGQETYDKLWKQLNDVGKNNTGQAEAAIRAVIAALDAQKKKQEEVAASSAAAAKKLKEEQDAATAGLRSRLSELSSEYDRLFESIKNEAPEEVMGIIEQQTRARMEAVRNEQVETQNALDKVLQSLEDSFAGIGEAAQQAAQTIQNAFNGITINPFQVGGGGGPHGPGLTIDSDSPGGFHVPSPSFSGGGGGTIVVQTVLDGRVIAETMAPHTAEYLQSQGL